MTATAQVTASFDMTTTNEVDSTVTKDLSRMLDVTIPPPGSPSDYLASYTVQPFFLQAEMNKAPWVPPNYDGNLPGCFARNVLSYTTVGGQHAGVAPAPTSASGTIRKGTEK